MEKIFGDLDLDWTMPNVELVRAYYNMFKFEVDSPIIFWVIIYTDTHTHTDGHEYSIVAVDKLQL